MSAQVIVTSLLKVDHMWFETLDIYTSYSSELRTPSYQAVRPAKRSRVSGDNAGIEALLKFADDKAPFELARYS